MNIDPKKVKKILGKNILADGFDPIIDLDKSYGSWLVDHRNGKEYLHSKDFKRWCFLHGYISRARRLSYVRREY